MIAVLPSDLRAELLDELLAEFASRGWSCETSAGRDQTVLTVAGPARAEEVEAVLATRVDADVLTLGSHETYVRLRRKRRVLHAIAWGLTLIVALGLGIPVLSYLRSPVQSLVASDTLRAALADDVPEHSALLVRSEDGAALLVHLEGEQFFAVSATCTHMDQCLLEWHSARQQIVCPCHGCTYDLYGNVISGPPSIPLASFAIEHFGDEIHLRRGN